MSKITQKGFAAKTEDPLGFDDNQTDSSSSSITEDGNKKKLKTVEQKVLTMSPT